MRLAISSTSVSSLMAMTGLDITSRATASGLCRWARKSVLSGSPSARRTQPPLAAAFALGFPAADEVALADHTDQVATGADDRNGADLVVQKDPGHFAQGVSG